MIQHPPQPMHPMRRPGPPRHDWHEPPQPWPQSPYGRDRDYEPEPGYAAGPPHDAQREWETAAEDDWQQGNDWRRGPGYRERDLNREQAHELDEYYGRHYATPPYPGGARAEGPRSRPLPGYRGQPVPGNAAHAQRHDPYGGGAGSWNAGGKNARYEADPAALNRSGHERPGHDSPGRDSPRRAVDYRGRAPKGYVRSDERIREDICERLSEDSLVDASDISVSVQSGVATLEGGVADRPQKHRAEDIADACSGVRDVRNLLSVAHRPGHPRPEHDAGRAARHDDKRTPF